MKRKEKHVMKKEEAGAMLIRLGEHLQKGTLVSPGAHGEDIELVVNDPLEVEVEYKEKHGRNKFEVEIKWPSRKGEEKVKEKKLRKALKKDMKATLYKLEKAVEAGRIKEALASFERLKELNNRFNELAENGWKKDMKAQNRLVMLLGTALTEGDESTATGMVNKLWRLKKACHSKYKEY